MRKATDSTPKDPRCRAWNAKENERRRNQAGHAHNVAQSVEIERVAAEFRAAKASRLAA